MRRDVACLVFVILTSRASAQATTSPPAVNQDSVVATFVKTKFSDATEQRTCLVRLGTSFDRSERDLEDSLHRRVIAGDHMHVSSVSQCKRY